ncbi:MAG: hypothetical protein WA821_12205 [Anaerolineales bacterium]
MTILIPGFHGAGTYVLRFDYRHDDNLLAPVSYQQRGVQVLKLGIYLALPPSPSCSDLIQDSTTCSISYADPTKAHILFYIRQTAGNDYLNTTMPQPILALNNESFWQVYEANSSGKSVQDFECQVNTKTAASQESTRLVYVLDCVANVVGKANLLVNYVYDNKIAPDYFMGNDPVIFMRGPFFLHPVGRTVVESMVNKPFDITVSVGSPAQIVIMTLINPDTTRPTLTDTNLANWFDVAYPSCMGLTGIITSNTFWNTTVEWTMTPATHYPCAGTLSIYYKENDYFLRTLLVSQSVQFAKPFANTPPTSAP